MTSSHSREPYEVIEVELDEEVTEGEIETLLWPDGDPHPVYYEYEQKKKVVNWGASVASVDWLVTLESLPSAGDWFLFALGLWLGNRQRRDGSLEVPDEVVGERAAKHHIVMKRPPIGVDDLERIGYESDRDTGLGTYTFLAPAGVQYEVKVASGQGGIRVRYMREVMNRAD